MKNLHSPTISIFMLATIAVMVLCCACTKSATEAAPAPTAPAKMVPNEDPEAQYKKGLAYFRGVGVNQDFKQAAEWFRKAADKGHALAQYNLGAMYGWGSGTNTDMTQAVAWLEKAAAQGITKAHVNLGLIYANGEGVQRDVQAAQKWFQMAADKGDEGARAILEHLKKDDQYMPSCPSLPKAKLCGPIEE